MFARLVPRLSVVFLLSVVLLLAACASSPAPPPTSSSSAPPPTTAPPVPSTSSSLPPSTSLPDEASLPGPDLSAPDTSLPGSGSPTSSSVTSLPDAAPSEFRVVLVSRDDVLNVRARPSASAGIVGSVEPNGVVEGTGRRSQVGGSVWVEVSRPHAGWVNGLYLAPPASDYMLEVDPVDVAAELARRFGQGEPFSDLVSEKGLWVSYHCDLMRFPRDRLDGLLSRPQSFPFGYTGLGCDASEIPLRTFKEAVADRFASAVLDSDTRMFRDSVVEGPNGRPAPLVVPWEFASFPYVSFFDPGDGASDGLDWQQWVVSFVEEDDALRVVGLTVDEWAP